MLKPKRKKFKLLKITLVIGLTIGTILPIATYVVVQDIRSQLPTVTVLKDIQLQTPLRIFSADGKLMAEFGEKRRLPTELKDMPQNLINAVIAIEDSRFYEHSGVDFVGLARAGLKLISSGDKLQGGSTITMQVARNFFLNRQKTYARKITEILLAMKIEHELSKDEILSLYLNKIFFGYRSYGVSAAAATYYGKDLKDLTLAESAMLAGLPKAPSAINPLTNPTAAIARRNHVLARMLHYGYIPEDQYQNALKAPNTASKHEINIELYAPYVTEMVRHALSKRWGDEIYTAGLQIYTTIDSKLQNYANLSTRNAVIKYEQRHGYSGPEDNWGSIDSNKYDQVVSKLQQIPRSAALESAMVVGVLDKNIENESSSNTVEVLTSSHHVVTIPWDGLSWARKRNKKTNTLDKFPDVASEVLRIGDVVRIWQNPQTKTWMLSQVPEVEAALVALDPKTGKLLALTGGYDFSKSNFNRATQAYRQAGSSLKPFIYSAALEKGFTAASIFNDAPIVINDPYQEELWRPQNDNKKFYGPTRLRTALVQSRNLVSIRLLQATGIEYTHDYLKRFGFNADQMPSSLSLALGTASVTPIQLAQAFSVIANGGYTVNPSLITKIKNNSGNVLYQDESSSHSILKDNNFEYYETQKASTENFKQVIPAENAYIIGNILNDAIKNGTGKKALELKRTDLSGKTGTSNENFDAWYCGFNSGLVTITWMGYDQPRSLHEYGATAALPMWVDFMGLALNGKPEEFLPMPNGVTSLRIDPHSGLLADNKQDDGVLELFVAGTEPKEFSSGNHEVYNINQHANSELNFEDGDQGMNKPQQDATNAIKENYNKGNNAPIEQIF